MNMSNITFEVARSDSCIFKKCLEKILFTIIFHDLVGIWCFGWDNVGPAEQTVAHHCIGTGPMYPCYLHGSGLSGVKASPALLCGSLQTRGGLRQFVAIEPAMGCDAGPTLNRDWWVGLHVRVS